RGSYVFRVSVSSPLLGGYDGPETLPYQIALNCPIDADVRQSSMSTASPTRIPTLFQDSITKTKKLTQIHWMIAFSQGDQPDLLASSPLAGR
ncbi:hypothetical protein, partial [Roseovarius sp. 2305UL8-3]|uniref:hypothetical protein n=1 Tax=Roseovarius conchicola TaxID=3121636 RepID=UPI003527C6FE